MKTIAVESADHVTTCGATVAASSDALRSGSAAAADNVFITVVPGSATQLANTPEGVDISRACPLLR